MVKLISFKFKNKINKVEVSMNIRIQYLSQNKRNCSWGSQI